MRNIPAYNWLGVGFGLLLIWIYFVGWFALWPIAFVIIISWMITKFRIAASRARIGRGESSTPTIETPLLPPPNPWIQTPAVYENGRPIHPPYVKENHGN